jgi:hypothetical protein
MVKIQRLVRPSKLSGFELEAGETTEIRGLTIVNRNNYSVYVDKFTRRKMGKSRRKKP